MSLPKYLTTVFCALFITIGAASGQEEKVYGEVGDKVSFGATSLGPSLSSIIWKQRNGGSVIKAIEWDEVDGVSAPNPRFKDITYLNETNGQITITNLKFEHSGIYTIDINSKEQEKRFKLEVLPQLPKPEITIDRADKNSVFVYLICKYSEMIIWNNSAGEKLDVKDQHPKGKFITVFKNGHPDDYYTCTLKNEVSEKTSDPVFRRDLFEESGLWWIVFIIIPILILALFAVFVILYNVWEKFHDFVNHYLKDTKCIGAILKRLDGKKNKDEGTAKEKEEEQPLEVGATNRKVNKDTPLEEGAEKKGEEEKQDDDK